MKRLSMLLAALALAPMAGMAVVLDSGITIQPPAAPTQAKRATNATQAKRLSEEVPQVGVTTANGAAQVPEGDIAIGVLSALVNDFPSASVPTTPPAGVGTAHCKPPHAASGKVNGIPLAGAYFACMHADRTGYWGTFGLRALSSYKLNPSVATGESLTASVVPGYASIDDYMNRNPGDLPTVPTPSSPLPVHKVSGVSLIPASAYDRQIKVRMPTLLLKEFDYMTQKLPNYEQIWNQQMKQAVNDFSSQMSALAASLGINYTQPLPANFAQQVAGAVGNQLASAGQLHTQAQQAGAAAGQLGNSPGGTGPATGAQNAATRIAGVTIPAAQQPLLNAVQKDIGNVTNQLALYDKYNRLYLRAYQDYLAAKQRYNNEASKKATPGAATYGHISCRRVSGVLRCSTNATITVTSITSLNGGGQVSPPSTLCVRSNTLCTKTRDVGLPTCPGLALTLSNGQTMYAHARSICGGIYAAGPYSHPYRLGKEFTLKSHQPGSPGPDQTLLALYKRQMNQALARMNKYMALRDKALRAAQAAYGKLQIDYQTLTVALKSAQQQLTNQGKAAAGNATNGANAGINTAALDAMVSQLGSLINMAKAVTNNLVNVVTVADLKKALGTLKKAYDALANLDGGLRLGDGLGTDAEVIAGAGGNAGGAGRRAGFLKINAKRDTPYRILKDVAPATHTMRTAVSMITTAVRAAGMKPGKTAPVPAVAPVRIRTGGAGGLPSLSDLRGIERNVRNAIHDI